MKTEVFGCRSLGVYVFMCALHERVERVSLCVVCCMQVKSVPFEYVCVLYACVMCLLR